MRTLLIAGVALGLAADGAAAQQRVVVHGPGASYGVPGDASAPVPPPAPAYAPQVRPAPPLHVAPPPRGPRWGGTVNGRWWGGVNAPGGYAAYRRPVRGYALPPYWQAPRFFVGDYAAYGLGRPPRGYRWVRYYDDAVLVDDRGSVFDAAYAVDWDRYDQPGYPGGYYADGYPATNPNYPAPGDRGYYRRPRSGLAGAAVGAAAGGVAGNLIAGRGNRLAGTLVGAGVGAGVGYAVDRAGDRRAPPPPPSAPDYAYHGSPSYGVDYPPPPPPAYAYPSGARWVSPDGSTTVTTGSGGYVTAPGYAYAPGEAVTTVTVQTAPVVTTTTTEYYEDAVTYTRPVRRSYRRRGKAVCLCR